MRRFFLILLLALGGAGFGGAPAALAAASSALGDFNGDGRADLAVGVPTEDVGTVSNAGAVSVLYGGASGLSAAGNRFPHQDQPGIRDVAEEGDEFGTAVAAGDFNGDGHADLAVGVPQEDVGTIPFAGVVNVLYGSAGGLSPTGNQLWHQNSPGVLDDAENSDGFGGALAAGDFDGDGHADLAIGARDESIRAASGEFSGAVNVLYGSATGLSAAGNQFWHQDSPGVPNEPSFGEGFGDALAAGDFDDDAHADLAIGVPGKFSNVGAVIVLYGTADGLAATSSQFWRHGHPGLDPFFGAALAAGDFNGDGRADLAVGVLGAAPDPSTLDGAGAVDVLYGTPDGLSGTGRQSWDQDSPGVTGAAEQDDFFGVALAAGDFNGDGRADLAVGVSGEDLDAEDVGAVAVLYGTPVPLGGGVGGLSAAGNQLWRQNSEGVLDANERGDRFGRALAAGDFNGDTRADLAVGVPSESVGTVSGAGAVNALYGRPRPAGGGVGGLSATGNQLWHQDRPGILDVAETHDVFGSALGSGAVAAP